MNVALVVLDTLRYDTFEAEFDWLGGRRFSAAYAPSHWTIPVHASLYTGRYASEVGVHGKSRTFDWEGTTLAEALADAGYSTRLFSANGQIYRWDGWTRGFTEALGPASVPPLGQEHGLDWDRLLHRTAGGYRRYLRALWECLAGEYDTVGSLRRGYYLRQKPLWTATADEVRDRIQATSFGDDEFLVVNLMDAHAPYYPPAAYRTVDDPVRVLDTDVFSGAVGDPERIERAYHDAVRYLSDTYRTIHADLVEAFDYVITLSDHGELLGEHGLWNHGYGLFPELTHVPLVVDGEDVPEEVVDRPVSLLDVHRTVAGLTGVDVESRGQHLLDGIEPIDRLTEYHGLLPWHRERFRENGMSGAEYDRLNEPLAGFVAPTGYYGYETHDDGFRSVEAAPEGIDDPEAHLAEAVAEVPLRSIEGEDDTDVPPGVRERLEDLGYA
ncbi:arylsulfatase [Halobacteriales archaeon QS_4_69_34]|nr:MAG: arylsulfatase [Halobacteriales archaeon QS_4_69_34]